MKVLFVGQNPSKKNIDPKVPFVGTKSEKILDEWFKILKLEDIFIVNAFDYTNKKYTNAEYLSSALDMNFVYDIYQFNKVIALGNIASKVLKYADIEHFKLPHPSGLNRKLNDKKWLNNELEKAKEYLYEQN